MRMMMTARLDTEKSSAAMKNGSLQPIIRGMLERIKPEAAYFGIKNGARSMVIVFDMQKSSEMPAIGERLLGELGAEIDFSPVMTADDLREGMANVSGG